MDHILLIITNYLTLLMEMNISRMILSMEQRLLLEAEPIKEGYIFSGWSEIPETMPANDVTVTGTFTIKGAYKLTYMVDGEEYKTYDIEYGSTITPEATPTKGRLYILWME